MMIERISNPFSVFGWHYWPKDMARPTKDEWLAAETRYRATCNPSDQSDYGLGLGFVMATYNRWIWWPFFFPDAPKLAPMVDFPGDVDWID